MSDYISKQVLVHVLYLRYFTRFSTFLVDARER